MYGTIQASPVAAAGKQPNELRADGHGVQKTDNRRGEQARAVL
jgi:hypothetical protein